MPAGDKNDPFTVRKWLKVLTQDLADAKYSRLSSAERGVLHDLERFSLRSSDIPGFFLSDGEPMTLADMLRGIAPRDFEQDEINRAAVQALREAGWLTYSEGEGFMLVRWADRQDKTIVEPEAARKKRLADRDRKRKQRSRQSEDGKEPVDLDAFRRPNGKKGG